MSRNIWLALCRMLFGALVAIPVGYLLVVVEYLNGDTNYSIYYWFYRVPQQPFGWMVFGAVLGGLWHVISRLNSN